MKRIELAQTVALLANIGIIASIIFLAFQMRDNNNQARVDVNQQVVGQVSNWERAVAADEGLTDIFGRGLSDFSSLSDIEQMRFDLLMTSRLRMFSSIVLSNELRVTEGAPDGPLIGQLRDMMGHQGFRQWWSASDHDRLSPRIVDLIESLRMTGDSENY